MTHHQPTILAAVLLVATCVPLAIAQTPSDYQAAPTPTFNRNIIFLDPAHGGPDTGALLPNHLAEKDFTLAFSGKLRAALASAGFAPIAPRDADPPVIISSSQRAALANRAHPLACILLHATASGTGVHLFTAPDSASTDSPQTAYSSPSLALANLVGTNLVTAKLPVILTPASVAPLDNLACTAIALEVAPLDDSTSPTDAAYQQRIIKAIVAALQTIRSQLPPPRPTPAPSPVTAPATGVTP